MSDPTKATLPEWTYTGETKDLSADQIRVLHERITRLSDDAKVRTGQAQRRRYCLKVHPTDWYLSVAKAGACSCGKDYWSFLCFTLYHDHDDQ